MNAELAQRDPRRYISKSFVQTADICGQRAWYQIHDPRPWVAPEKVTFGSAVDAGVEAIVKALSKGEAPDLPTAHDAAMLRVESDENVPDEDEVLLALKHFVAWPIVAATDWKGALTQPHLRLELPGIGEVDAHPDLFVGDGIVDIKTSARAKHPSAAATSYTELGLYALLYEAAVGERPETVAYWTYVRSARPYWQAVDAPVTDHLLSVARHRVAAVARAIEADGVLNDGMAVPTNSVFVNGPRFGCGDCAWHPGAGGPCQWAEEEAAA